ncbi:MAG: LytTR family transcriptional regulator DNA-binding domain-containing protein [Prevotellaceae bacterium]|jgi:hypothetical protein|nr:LytTR family transcriptional regulator DNA-binding domain-containing protein [Prevotellaceae bacterium]
MRYKTIGISFAWMILGLINALILGQFICLNFSVLVAHSLAMAVFFCGLSFLLEKIIRFANFGTFSFFQKAVNYAFLAIFTISIWVGLSAAFDFIFFEKQTAIFFLKLNFIYVPVGVLAFVIIAQRVVIQANKSENILQNEEIAGQARNDTSDRQTRNDVFDRQARNDAPLKQIAVKSNSKINVIPLDDVLFLSSDGDYVLIHTETSKFLKEQTMKYFETHLPENFIRIHRSFIVNSQKISRVELLEKQTYYLILKNNQRIKMSVAGYKLLRQKLRM